MQLSNKTYFIELENNREKKEIISNRSKLKNFKEIKAYINNNLTDKERQVQRSIEIIAAMEKDKSKPT